MSYSEKDGQGWHKRGQRCFRRDGSELFNAVIFGAPAPQQLWAWAVWSSHRTDEGVEFSLAAARTKATAVIGRLNEEVKRNGL
jgi:hypothetical protein